MSNSKIEWTDKTWNPITGCTKASSGCAHCYAEVMARRLKGMGQKKYQNGFTLTLHPENLSEPLKWKKPHNIFVCSMSDMFHESVPYEFIDQIMLTISSTPQHRYQLLTKRAARMEEYFSNHQVPDNVWLGVTVECKSSIHRIEHLRHLPAKVRFLSCEPLLEDLGVLNLENINWVIAGGETGIKARPMLEPWLLNLKKQADDNEIAFFFKRWSSYQDKGKKNSEENNLLEGRIIQEYPTHI